MIEQNRKGLPWRSCHLFSPESCSQSTLVFNFPQAALCVSNMSSSNKLITCRQRIVAHSTSPSTAVPLLVASSEGSLCARMSAQRRGGISHINTSSACCAATSTCECKGRSGSTPKRQRKVRSTREEECVQRNEVVCLPDTQMGQVLDCRPPPTASQCVTNKSAAGVRANIQHCVHHPHPHPPRATRPRSPAAGAAAPHPTRAQTGGCGAAPAPAPAGRPAP